MECAIGIEVGPGELIDRLTILEIKRERIRDARKLANVEREFISLTEAFEAALRPSAALRALRSELRVVNARLWEIEDEIRDCERRQDFGPSFVSIARAIYRNNDLRAGIKREINELLGSALIEEKSYAPY